MIKKIVALYFLSVVLCAATSAHSKDLVLIFSYDCEYNGQFGAVLANEISVLKNIGWETRYYCGDKELRRQDYLNLAVNRNGALQEENIDYELSNLTENTNIMILFNTHGGEAFLADDYQDDGDQIVSLGKMDSFNEFNFLWASKIMRKLMAYQKRNPESFVFHLNGSCYSGRSIKYIEKNSAMCSLTIAPDNRVGYSDNYWDMAFRTMPGTLGNSAFGMDENESDPIEYAKNKDFYDAFADDLSKMDFSSLRIKDVIKTPLWFDRSTIAFTHGFGLDELNESKDEVFLEKYKKISENFSPASREVANVLIQEFQKQIDKNNTYNWDFYSSDVYEKAYEREYWEVIHDAIERDNVLIKSRLRENALQATPMLPEVHVRSDNDLKWDIYVLEGLLKNLMFTYDLPHTCDLSLFNRDLTKETEERLKEINLITTPAVCDAINKLQSLPRYKEDMKTWRQLKKGRDFENERFHLAELYKLRQSNQAWRDGMIRNRMMSLALSETESRCGSFNLDRRNVP